MSALGSLVVKLALEYAEYTKGLDKSSQEALKYGQNVQRSIDQAEAKVSQHFSNTIRGATAAAAAYLGVSSAIGALNTSINDLAGLDDLAQKTGGAVENLSRMQKVAVQFGYDFGAIDPLLIKFAKNLNGIDDESGKAATALRALGISQEFVRQNDPAAVFIEATKRLQGYADGASKVDLITDLMGKSAADSLPYFNDLAENVDRFTGVSAEAAAKAAAFQDKLGALKVGSQELVQSLTMGLLPTLTSVVDKLNDLGNSKGVQSALVVYGTDSEDYAAKLAETEEKLKKLVKARDELSKPTAANKINDFLFGDVYDLNKQISVAQDVIATLKPLVSAKNTQDAASPYVTPNDDKPNLNYESAEVLAKRQAEAAKRQAAAQKLETSYSTLIGKSGDYIAAMQYEAITGEKVTAGQKQIADLQTFLIANYDSLNASQRQKIEADIRGVATEDALSAAQQARYDRIARMAQVDKEALEQQQAHLDGLSAATSVYIGLVSSEEEQIKTVQDQINVLKYGREAASQMSTARLLDAAAAYEQNAAYAEQNGVASENIKSMRDRAQALRDLASARDTLTAKQVELDAINKIKSFAESTWTSISDGLTNALFRGFENGKSFADNFFDTLKNTAKTTVLKFTTEFILSPVKNSITSALFGGGSSSASGAAANLAGQSFLGGSSGAAGQSLSQTLFSSIGTSLGNLGSALGSTALSTFSSGLAGHTVGTLVGQGPTVAGSATGLGSLAGSNLSNAGSFLSNYGGYIGAAVQALQGDLKGAAFTAAGAAIGSFIPGVGTAIGAVVGNLVGGLFGGGAPLRNWAEVTSKYDTSDNFKVTNTLAKRGGTAVISPLTDLNKAFSKQLDGFMETMGSDAALRLVSSFSTRPDHDTKAALSGSINGKSFSLGEIRYDENDTKAWSKYVSTVLGKGMVAAIRASNLEQGFKDLFKGFTGQDSVSKLMGYVVDFKNASEELMDTYGITAETAAKIARQGGSTNKEILAFTQTFAEFSLGLMKQSEQLLLARDNMTKAMSDIVDGVSTPSSLDAFDAILANIDTTTKAGQKQFADLFKLRDTYSEYQSSIDTINSDVYSSLYSLLTPSGQLAEQQKTLAGTAAALGIAVPTSADELIKLGQSIDTTTEAGLDLAIAFPTLVSAFQAVQDASDSVAESLGVSSSRFKSLFDYLNYKALAGTYGASYAEATARATGTIKGFASGGSFSGGLRLVGENGPELEVTGPSRIINNADTSSILQALGNTDQSALIAEIRALKAEVSSLRSEQRSGMVSVVRETKRGSDTLEKFDRLGVPVANYNGGSLKVDVDDATPVQVEVVTP